jgi:hypothetical protein
MLAVPILTEAKLESAIARVPGKLFAFYSPYAILRFVKSQKADTAVESKKIIIDPVFL